MGLRNLFSSSRLSRELEQQRLRAEEAEARLDSLEHQLALAESENTRLADENSKLQDKLTSAAKEITGLKTQLKQSLIEEQQLLEIEKMVEEMQASRLRYDKKIARLKERLADYEKALKKYISQSDDELGAIEFLSPHSPSEAPMLLRPANAAKPSATPTGAESHGTSTQSSTTNSQPSDDDWFVPLNV